MRERLPDTRASITHKAVILAAKNGKPKRVKFYFTVGLFPDGRPGELFIHMDEAGSTLDGMADTISILISLLSPGRGAVKQTGGEAGLATIQSPGFNRGPGDADGQEHRGLRDSVDGEGICETG